MLIKSIWLRTKYKWRAPIRVLVFDIFSSISILLRHQSWPWQSCYSCCTRNINIKLKHLLLIKTWSTQKITIFQIYKVQFRRCCPIHLEFALLWASFVIFDCHFCPAKFEKKIENLSTLENSPTNIRLIWNLWVPVQLTSCLCPSISWVKYRTVQYCTVQ